MLCTRGHFQVHFTLVKGGVTENQARKFTTELEELTEYLQVRGVNLIKEKAAKSITKT